MEEDPAFLGISPEMVRLRRLVRDVADADVDVLVFGETGSGKEVVASALHRWSRRASRNFVAMNCGALPDSVVESELFGHEAGAFTGALKRRVGRIEYAQGGTLFLDEIESMPLGLQVKLLRVLQERAVEPLGSNEIRAIDMRVVAATKVDLGQAAAQGTFRDDLYHRLNVITIAIPPLRERREDVMLLFQEFLTRAALRFGREPRAITPAVREHLRRHDWPGNVRELGHFAERHALGLGQHDAPSPEAASTGTLAEQVDRFERGLIREELIMAAATSASPPNPSARRARPSTTRWPGTASRPPIIAERKVGPDSVKRVAAQDVASPLDGLIVEARVGRRCGPAAAVPLADDQSPAIGVAERDPGHAAPRRVAPSTPSWPWHPCRYRPRRSPRAPSR